jgi:hypothetical protein
VFAGVVRVPPETMKRRFHHGHLEPPRGGWPPVMPRSNRINADGELACSGERDRDEELPGASERRPCRNLECLRPFLGPPSHPVIAAVLHLWCRPICRQ